MNGRKSKFHELISDSYNKYYTYLEGFTEDELKKEDGNYLPTQLLAFLKQKDIKNRGEQDWLSLKVRLDEIKNIKKLANPYFIGFGNPESDVLIIGKEKAIDVLNKPKTFLNESINNTLHWKTIVDGKENNLKKFNPRLPYTKGEEPEKKGTWYFCNDFISELQCADYDSNATWHENLFKNCFMTELNHRPSKTSDNSISEKICEERKEILKENFFHSFPITIIGTGNYDIPSSFISDHLNIKSEVKVLGKNKSGKEISVTLWSKEDHNRHVILCKQLNWQAGWNRKSVNEFTSLINNLSK